MTVSDAWKAAQDWTNAWNARDLDAIMTHYADEVTFWSPTGVTRLGIESGKHHGKDRLRAHFARGL